MSDKQAFSNIELVVERADVRVVTKSSEIAAASQELKAARELLACAKETKDAAAAMFRAVGDIPGAWDQVERALAVAGVPNGFGVRLQVAIAACEKECAK